MTRVWIRISLTLANTVTASGKSQLRGMAITKLRVYLDAYGIKPKSMLEKDDLIEAIIDARVGGSMSIDLPILMSPRA
jgi:hypothetical protein